MNDMNTITQTDIFTVAYDRLLRRGNFPEWLRELKSRSMEEFTRRGFPTTRDEEWRFTNIASITRTQFAFSESSDVELPEAMAGSKRIVLIDGRGSSKAFDSRKFL